MGTSTHLRDVEVDEQPADDAAASVDVTDLRSKVGLSWVIQVRQGESHRPCTDPEACCADGNDLGLVPRVAQLARAGPCKL